MQHKARKDTKGSHGFMHTYLFLSINPKRCRARQRCQNQQNKQESITKTRMKRCCVAMRMRKQKNEVLVL